MKQNINLYQPITGGGAGRGLNARIMLMVGAATLLAVTATQFWLGGGNGRIDKQLQAVMLELTSTEVRLNELTAAKMAGADPLLEAQLNEALRELDLRETILGLVSGDSVGDIGGFSGQLVSLARQNAEGIWLTRIRVSAPGARTTLEGRALSPAAVPLYLQQLSVEAALAGQGFDVFEIQRPEKAGETVRFSLNRRDAMAPVRLVRK